MPIRSRAISAADWMAVRSGAARVLRSKYAGKGAALMFHRVQVDPEDQLNHENCFSQGGLRSLLEYCRRAGVAVVDIDEALRRLRGGTEGRFVVLTFDDGYRDNYTHALPVMEEFDAPFTVFVCSSIINRTFDYWWGGLIEMFRTRDRVDIEAMGICFTLTTPRDRERALRKTTMWVEERITERSAQLQVTFRRYSISPADLLDQDAMTESELRTFSESPLVTIGGHGFSHHPLASLPDPEAAQDILANREHLQGITGGPVVHFAYPFGDSAACGWREAEMVQGAGYRGAFTTRVGNLFAEHAETPFMLPRGAMKPGREAGYHLESQLAGVHRFLQSRGGPPVHPDTVRPR